MVRDLWVGRFSGCPGGTHSAVRGTGSGWNTGSCLRAGTKQALGPPPSQVGGVGYRWGGGTGRTRCSAGAQNRKRRYWHSRIAGAAGTLNRCDRWAGGTSFPGSARCKAAGAAPRAGVGLPSRPRANDRANSGWVLAQILVSAASPPALG